MTQKRRKKGIRRERGGRQSREANLAAAVSIKDIFYPSKQSVISCSIAIYSADFEPTHNAPVFHGILGENWDGMDSFLLASLEIYWITLILYSMRMSKTVVHFKVLSHACKVSQLEELRRGSDGEKRRISPTAAEILPPESWR